MNSLKDTIENAINLLSEHNEIKRLEIFGFDKNKTLYKGSAYKVGLTIRIDIKPEV